MAFSRFHDSASHTFTVDDIKEVFEYFVILDDVDRQYVRTQYTHHRIKRSSFSDLLKRYRLLKGKEIDKFCNQRDCLRLLGS